MIKVRIARTNRDGAILKWRDDYGVSRQQKCSGRTQRAQETERRQLEEQLNDRSKDLLWEDFWDQYCENHLDQLSPGHRRKCRVMQTRLVAAADRLGIRRLRCGDINAAVLLEVEAELRRCKNEPATVKSNMDSLWSVLGWGQDYELIPHIPRPRRRRGKQSTQIQKSKGRPLTDPEIKAMRSVIKDVCKATEAPAGFENAFDAMRLIGFRLSEAWMFSWEPKPGCHYPVRLYEEYPAIQFDESQKSGVREVVPLTWEAANWLRTVRRESDWICRTTGKRGEHETASRLQAVLRAAGKRAKIVVKRNAKGNPKKHASAQDLRRTFVAHLSKLGLATKEKQLMSRHSTAQVMLDFYDAAIESEVAKKLRVVG